MMTELLDEQTFESLLPDRQQAVIEKHCRGIVGLIKGARDSDDATRIVARACDAFEQECSSSLVRNALLTYLTGKKAEFWSQR